MKNRKRVRGAIGIATVTSVAGLMTIGCAYNQDQAQGRHRERNRVAQEDTAAGGYRQGRTQDTSWDQGAYRNDTSSQGVYQYPGTGGSTGSGTGGGAMPDSGYNDSLGIYGPTGPMPGDTGVGGGLPPADTLFGDSLAPPDTDAWPDGRANGDGSSGGSTW